MRITPELTDELIFQELGDRLAKARLDHNLTQAALAEEAGVSKRMLERLESGEASTQLSACVRICRALDLVERLDLLIPESTPSPIAQLKVQGKRRKRASGNRPSGKRAGPAVRKKWTWGDES